MYPWHRLGSLLLLSGALSPLRAAEPLQAVPERLDFGQVPVRGQRSAEVCLVNPGLEPVLIHGLELQGAGYELPAPPLTAAPLFLPASGRLRFAVRFVPVRPGQSTGELRVEGPDLELPLPLQAQATAVAIDEVLADPPAGSAGDVNGDGKRHSYEDEFAELVNTGPDPVDLAGWTLGDASGKQVFTFPWPALLPPGGRAVVFGGGAPRGIPGLVFAARGRIGDGLNNSGDEVWLADADGDTASRMSGVDWDQDQSLVRFPAGSDTFVPHTAPPGRGERFSPGRDRTVLQALELPPAPAELRVGDSLDLHLVAHYSDGASEPIREGIAWTLSDSAAALVRGEQLLLRQPGPLCLWASWHGLRSDPRDLSILPLPPRPPRPRPTLLLTELLADPPAGPEGDANGDGRPDPEEDEFVELLNTGPDPVDLAGWRLSDDDTSPQRQFRFPAGAVLAPGQYLVLFGGGAPQGIPGLVFADDGRLGNGLGNSGDRILLLADEPPDTLLDLSYTCKTDLDQSLVFLDSAPVPHGRVPGRGFFSPGRPRPLYTHFAIDTLRISAGQPPAALVLRGYPGAEFIDPSLANWRTWDSEVIQLDRGGRVHPLQPGRAQVFAWIEPEFLAAGTVLVGAPPPPPNQPPRLVTRPDTTVYAGGHYRYQARAVDPEKATLIYTLAQGPPWLHLHWADGLLWGQAPLQGPAQVEVAFEVEDGRGGLDCQRFLLRVLPRPQIRIREILADPPPGAAGDANGDGERQTYGDEFVELVDTGPDPVDLAGWRLSDGDVDEKRQFRFPARAILATGECAVVFGGGTPQGIPGLVFAGDGRLGDGLGNLADEVYLIAPEGPDTLAQACYQLERESDQSLCYEADESAPALHSQYPGRDLCSPGRPRPLVQSLRLTTERLYLVKGERARLGLVGRFSDGGEQEVSYEANWTCADAAVRLDRSGALEAVRPGIAQVLAQVDGFVTPECQVQVDQPLPECVRFSPTWKQLSVPPGAELVFAALDSTSAPLSFTWSVDDQPQACREARMLHRCLAGQADTVRVEVRRRHEVVSRQWVLRPNLPPRFEPFPDTLVWAGKPYQAQVRARDPDGDALLYLLVQAPPGALLDPSQGQLSWTPALEDTGRFPLQVRVLDGSQEALMACGLQVLPVPTKPVSADSLLGVRSHPNPFSSSTALRFHLPEGPATAVSVRVYDLAGQLVRPLLDQPLLPGRHEVEWDGRDSQGRIAAAGVYLYQVQCGDFHWTGKLLRLR